MPENKKTNKKYAAVVSAHPIGSCKEQTSGNVYGTALADAGFVVVAFDASFQGASVENLVSLRPSFPCSDFRFVVDYIQTLPYVDPERIGVLGICGGGGYALNAIMTDYRFKACVGFAQFDPVGTLEMIGQQRTAEAQGAERNVIHYLHLMSKRSKNNGDVDVPEAFDYYKTDRGQKPNGAASGLFSFNSAAVSWDAFGHAEHIVVLPNTTHYELYDKPEAVKPALEKAIPFLKEHLKA
ncbi:hypothetical protein CA3LBN_004226 [Candidozyma haemuli]|uniref:Dienelactone hydrolase domain-containing protein n=1 Tax=Candidozyma haemuli TaxID=45357 RepID=A0ABX8IEB6_9ASCO|nr:hypothetical protein CA3LBN_004226 [[Candida] haemuloni]